MRTRYPVGAELLQRPGDDGVFFRVWAPRRRRISVEIEASPRVASAGALSAIESVSESETRVRVELERESDGYFSRAVTGVGPGARYRFAIDGEGAFPDPASRFQPNGPNGESMVVDPRAFAWSDADWRGLSKFGQVLYEMHIGTFTAEGTWSSAADHLFGLADLGITAIEVMPVADFPGTFGWGYDGVNLYAPSRLYGTPDDFRRFVDRAHSVGIGVILDVVYNHFGPSGNFLRHFAEEYFTDRYENEWGAAINFDGEMSAPVREFIVSNAAYWIDEFHLDGLRLDATQQMFDASETHIIADIASNARRAAGERSILLIAENEPQESRLIRPVSCGGMGLDLLWNDDFHHTAVVALTGVREAYYTDYSGAPQEFLSAIKWGYLYQGQRYAWQRKRRGTSALDLEPGAFILFLENHDQVANSAGGKRLSRRAAPGAYRAITALLLLSPGTPMIFQGEEYGSAEPFFYFADHDADLAEAVELGRTKFLSQFPSLTEPDPSLAPPPHLEATFLQSKLHHPARHNRTPTFLLHRDLLRLRRTDQTIGSVIRSSNRHAFDGAQLGSNAFVVRFFGEESASGDRLLIINLGPDLHFSPAPEPLLGPPEDAYWVTLWSSEHHQYGGRGTAPLERNDGWHIPGLAAVLLKPDRRGPEPEVTTMDAGGDDHGCRR